MPLAWAPESAKVKGRGTIAALARTHDTLERVDRLTRDARQMTPPNDDASID